MSFRTIAGELLPLVALWVESLAIHVGGPRVAESYLKSHRDPSGRYA